MSILSIISNAGELIDKISAKNCILCDKPIDETNTFFCNDCIIKDKANKEVENNLKSYEHKDELRKLCKILKNGTYEEINAILKVTPIK